MAAAQVEVVGEAEQQEILQGTEQEAAKVPQEQEEAAKVQEKQEATSDNIQEEKGETREDNTKPTVVTKDGGTFSKRSLSEAAKGKREI